MSRTFQAAVGGLLLLLAATLAVLFLASDAGPRVARALGAAEVVAVVGVIFLVQGLRSPFGPKQRTALRRRLALANLVIGPLVVAVSAGLLWVKYQVVTVLPDSLSVPALLGIPIGVFVTASLFRLVCARCGSPLASARATAAQLGRWAEAAGPLARGAAWVEHCPRCRGVAVLGPEKAPVVLRDAEARALVARILDAPAGAADPEAPPPIHATFEAPRLPQRPLRLEPGYAGATLRFAAIVSLACLAAGVAFGVDSLLRTRARLADLRIAAAGVAAAEPKVTVRETADHAFGITVLPFFAYDLNVTWRDGAGRARVADQRVVSWFERADTNGLPVVFLDAADPARAAVSWMTRLRYGPFLANGWGAIVAVVLLSVALRAVVDARRTVRAARACADRGAEVQFPVLALAEAKNGLGGRTGRWHLTVGLPGRPRDARGTGRTVTLRGPPILVGTEKDRRAIGLVADGRLDEAVFPLADLRPFLPPEPREDVASERPSAGDGG